ncbi:Lysophospholipase, alpha-beta hydrolase superfamily [Eubacterium oxidoreducens]|uniref:Lysophospholipase, alpha-beta hydrolase superfamily n=1 Tax=Eubacterium oxidoreducens TaxID=1732 RepID=A0A1G5ZZS5_EUBOX|nr:Lysophospholipase, alpha-beta hydrolase superfamily [Eubacterium oxidoreducens]
MKEEFTFLSKDGITKIHGVYWIPNGEIKAVLQIVHGMDEYIERYEEFALFLNEHGYLVAGHDHLGHGQSIRSEEDLGFFARENGNECLLSDIHTLRKKTAAAYPKTPYFVMGHSMGSFLIRQYIQDYSQGLAGCIIMGTGMPTDGSLKFGKMLCKIIAGIHNWHYRSRFLNNLIMGSYNKKFGQTRMSADWLTKNNAVVDKYLQDPLCTFVFTLNGYYNMFLSIEAAKNQANIAKTPSTFPLFLVSGGDDPVGQFGSGVNELYELFKKIGMSDCTMRLYLGDRHEILNETDKDTVFCDLLRWLEGKRSEPLV